MRVILECPNPQWSLGDRCNRSSESLIQLDGSWPVINLVQQPTLLTVQLKAKRNHDSRERGAADSKRWLTTWKSRMLVSAFRPNSLFKSNFPAHSCSSSCQFHFIIYNIYTSISAESFKSHNVIRRHIPSKSPSGSAQKTSRNSSKLSFRLWEESSWSRNVPVPLNTTRTPQNRGRFHGWRTWWAITLEYISTS